MKIYRISGVEDFMGGVSEYDLDRMPPEDQLTTEQRRKIRDETLSHGNPSKNLKYFLKYPNCAYLSLWDIAKCSKWGEDPETIRVALESWLSINKIDYGIPYDLPEWAYDLIIKHFRSSAFSIEVAGDVLTNEDKLPERFVQFIASKFPEISNGLKDTSINKRKALVKSYIEFPSKETLEILKNIQTKTEMDTSNPEQYSYRDAEERSLSFDIKRYLLNDIDMWWDHAKKIMAYNDDSWSMKSEEMLEELDLVRDAYSKNKQFYKDGNPFSIVVGRSDFGITKTLFLGNKVTKTDIVDRAIQSVGKSVSNNYWYMYWGETGKLQYEIENFPEGAPASVYLINEDGNNEYYDLADGGGLITTSRYENNSYSSEPFVDGLKSVVRITEKEETDLYREWIDEKLSSGKLTNQEYLAIVQSRNVQKMTEKAGQDLYSTKIQNNTVLNAESYNPNRQTSWRESWPFYIQSALDIWSKIPLDVRSAAASEVGSWFLCLSGLFPCNKVLEFAKKWPSDMKKVKDHIACTGDSEKLRQEINSIIDSKLKEVKDRLDKSMPSFLGSEAVKKYQLSNFSEVYAQAVEAIKHNLEDEKSYGYSDGKDVSKIDKVIKSLGETNVYFIDANKYMQFLGEDGINYFSHSPRDCNGFFIDGYSEFGDNPSIVIFTDQTSSMPNSEQILKELGIYAKSNDLSLSEENTLWHEVAHAFLSKIVYGRSYGEIENESQWLTSPQEISAITYGNLQHIKKRIKEYFESIYPFPERITQGLLSQIKSDIIDVFAWEFQGMSKREALYGIKSAMPEFDEEAMEAMQSMSKEEQIDMMTYMFTEFFMRKMMKSKVEDQLSSQMKEVGKDINKIDFREEIVIPEDNYSSSTMTQRDEIISQISKRQDYQQFIAGCQQIIKNEYNTSSKEYFLNTYRPYIARNSPQSLHPIFGFEDLLLLMFGPPATISSVNIENTNSLFESVIPQQLLFDVREIVKRQRKLDESKVREVKETPVSPDEADEAGQFITEMDKDYGPDWMWVAKDKSHIVVLGNKNNWYRMALSINKLF